MQIAFFSQSHTFCSNFYSTTLPTPSNISHKGHVKSSLQADLSEGEKVQGSLVLRSRVVDELQSAKEVYHCTNNLEERTTRSEVGRRRAWKREAKKKTGGAREGKMEERETGKKERRREGSEEKG